ncbi:hypothetical protein ACLKA6_012374 [Drosophila palustris]
MKTLHMLKQCEFVVSVGRLGWESSRNAPNEVNSTRRRLWLAVAFYGDCLECNLQLRHKWHWHAMWHELAKAEKAVKAARNRKAHLAGKFVA